MTFSVPHTLETDRLVLRQFLETDWRDLHDYYSDVAATRYTVGRAFSEGETWRILCTMVGHWQLRGYGPYAVEEKASGKVLGPVGFWYPNDWPGPEVKWALAPQHWGQGYASEAARAVQRAAWQHLPELSLISFIHSANEPSAKLALAVGAAYEASVRFRGGEWEIYRHPLQT